MADEEEPLLGLVRILKPMDSAERHRAVNAAMLYVGEAYEPGLADQGHGAGKGRAESHDGAAAIDRSDYPKGVASWMKQSGLTADEVDCMLQFHDDGTFAIHGVPGKSRKEQTLNTYIMLGVCTYLLTNNRNFDDAAARQHCTQIGCLDKPNHAAFLSDHGPEFSGDKNKGWSISNQGLKKGVALVKLYAEAHKK